jgi:DNA-binding MarR family transcriptional regulator
MSGWIKLHRKLSENPLWTSEPFTRGQAWVDLILLANHEYGFFFLRDHKIEVQRGQVGYSQLKLAERWKWSRTKVKNFLNTLEKEQQVIQQQSHSTGLVTIVNYEEYQKKEQLDIQQEDNRKATEKQLEDTNKKNKEEKEEKEEYKAAISPVKEKPKKNPRKKQVMEITPTLDEVKAYFKENGYCEDAAVKSFNFYDSANWYDSKGNKVVSWKQKMQGVWFTDENRDKNSLPTKHTNGTIDKKTPCKFIAFDPPTGIMQSHRGYYSLFEDAIKDAEMFGYEKPTLIEVTQ